MGAWGPALYDDDSACDLRDTLALLCKVPEQGPWLLEQAKAMAGQHDPADPDGALFWLVVADQFERKGIACPEAASMAQAIIANGIELAHARSRNADEKFIKKRALMLEQLAARLLAPRAPRSKARPAKPPEMVLARGEIHAFPTMNGLSWSPWRLDSAGPFVPDGWGALIVLDTGRAFDWLPWCGLASLTVSPERKPTLADALQARLIFHLQTEGAGRFIPKPAHARGMQLALLGTVELSPTLVAAEMSTWSVTRALAFDWSIAHAAVSAQARGRPLGPALSGLLKRG